MVRYGEQNLNQDDFEAVLSVLGSDFLTQGPVLEEFQSQLAFKVGVKYAIGFNSATSALHSACVALGISKGDIVWTSAISFAASANCAAYLGAKIEFLDIDISTRNILVDALETKLKYAAQINALPKAIVVVHFGGLSADMKSIHSMCKKYGIFIIEDASHAIGGQRPDGPVGDCKYSDMTVFSFHPVKIITTGEGGAACTNSTRIKSLLESHRSHGITRDQTKFVNEENADKAWYYEQQSLGYNYRLTDLQAALGVSQLKRLDSFIHIRNEIYQEYNSYISSRSHQHVPDGFTSAHHIYTLLVDESKNRDTIFNKYVENGIGVNLHYIPIYRHPYYQKLGIYDVKDYPNSEDYFSRTITIPLHTKLTKGEREQIINITNELIP